RILAAKAPADAIPLPRTALQASRRSTADTAGRAARNKPGCATNRASASADFQAKPLGFSSSLNIDCHVGGQIHSRNLENSLDRAIPGMFEKRLLASRLTEAAAKFRLLAHSFQCLRQSRHFTRWHKETG